MHTAPAEHRLRQDENQRSTNSTGEDDDGWTGRPLPVAVARYTEPL